MLGLLDDLNFRAKNCDSLFLKNEHTARNHFKSGQNIQYSEKIKIVNLDFSAEN